MHIERISPTSNFHRVVKYNGTAYLSGLVADDGDATLDIQVHQVIDKLEAVLGSINAGLNDVISVTIFMTDMTLKPLMNRIWLERFPSKCLPARATVGVSDLDGPYLLEITAIAACQ
ncbi:RidA family protein [Pantoea ananatis]|uniref:RidA family protein n=1 Tax=Pantoea ananas TaxID=553 RepID=UPI00119EAE29|nr:RidA family protein [Pantoea ananatis]